MGSTKKYIFKKWIFERISYSTFKGVTCSGVGGSSLSTLQASRLVKEKRLSCVTQHFHRDRWCRGHNDHTAWLCYLKTRLTCKPGITHQTQLRRGIKDCFCAHMCAEYSMTWIIRFNLLVILTKVTIFRFYSKKLFKVEV